MNPQKEQQLIKAIQKACPDIEMRNISAMIPRPFTGIVNFKNKDITLADVLRAYELKEPVKDLKMATREDMMDVVANVFELVSLWDKEKNRLQDQSDEVKKFLYKLIVK